MQKNILTRTETGTFVQGVRKSETMKVKAGCYDFMRFALRAIEAVWKLTDPPAIAYNNSVSDQ